MDIRGQITTIRNEMILLGSDLRAYGNDAQAQAIISAITSLPDESLYQMKERIVRMAIKLRA